MFTDRLFRSTSPDTDPARRLNAVSRLPPDSGELAELLAKDPAPAVRIAAANRCVDIDVLASAWNAESEGDVRAALAARLGTVLSESEDGALVAERLAAPWCNDAIRADVARRTSHPERRRAAIMAIGDEAVLIELALTADIADARLAAAERVRAPEGLRKIAEAAKEKDRGLARLARHRLEAMNRQQSSATEADAILAELEAVASTPGPILTRVIELNRRWEALDVELDPERLARCEAARQTLQQRFDSEHAEQRARSQFERELADWLSRAEPPVTSDELDARRSELSALRERGQQPEVAADAGRLDEAEQRIAQWTRALDGLASAEAIVVEAEQLAAGTSVDDAKLPERWQALDRSVRPPALTRRFEAALTAIEQRRLAHVHAAQQEASLARQQVHALLHTAEQAVAAGQLQAARSAIDEIRGRKSLAGQLPKPTLQRMGRVTQQLNDLERWKSFGQYQACVQLCERAEAAASLKADPPQVAREVQSLRNEWTALEKQHGDIPAPLRERFDRACEKAYAPAARYFAEQAAVRKQARKRREEFIAAAAAHAATLLGEPRDWRAIERWMRDTDRQWREGELGSVDPKAWKALDAQLKAALTPLRDAFNAERDAAKERRLGLIAEARALESKAMERDAPAQVKALQSQWQAQAKGLTLAKRDEAALWEQFRAACNAVFEARESKRKEAETRQSEARGALESLCKGLEQLAGTDMPEQELRRAARELQDQWKQQARPSDPAARALEPRFTRAREAIETALSRRARSRETAVWHTLAAKERLCEELDRSTGVNDTPAIDESSVRARWTALAALPAAWEKAMIARRDAALRALADPAAAAAHAAQVQRTSESRREKLLELELLLGIASPPELQAERRALQLRQLRDRFQGAGVSDPKSAGERLVAWCAQPGTADAGDRQRCERIFVAMERVR